MVLFHNCAMVRPGTLILLRGLVSSTAPTHTQNCNSDFQVSLVWSCDDFGKSVSQTSTDLPMSLLVQVFVKGNKTHLFASISCYAFVEDKVVQGAHYYLHNFFCVFNLPIILYLVYSIYTVVYIYSIYTVYTTMQYNGQH